MKNKQFVIEILLLVVGLHVIRCTFATGQVARLLDVMNVLQLGNHLENIIPHLKNKTKPGGISHILKGDDTTSGNLSPISERMAVSSIGNIFGQRTEPEVSPVKQAVNSGTCSLINYLKNKMGMS